MPAPVLAAAARSSAAKAGAAKAGAGATRGAAAQKAAIGNIKAARPRPKGSGSTPATKPEHIPTTEEVDEGITSADLEARDRAVRSVPNRRPPRLPSALTGQQGAPAAFRRFRDPVRAANTGGGFLLGLGLYGLGLTYLRGGKPAVLALLRAKFLNQVQS